jgi:predicted NBD/HSP70 family sugar kinase
VTDLTTGADASAVRRWNERVVVEAMTGRRHLRVAEVAALTGLTAASSRDVLRSLEAKGWIRAAEPERVGMGRPARTFELRDPPARVLGVDVGGHTVRAVLLAPDGTIEPLSQVDIRAPRDRIESTLAAIRARSCRPEHDVWMTGLALSGRHRRRGHGDGSVALPHLEGRARPVPSRVLPGRLLICHDTRAALWAETTIGDVAGTPHVMLVHLGRRPSIALMLNGQTYFGAHGTAGDLSLTELIPPWEQASSTAEPSDDAVGDMLRAAVSGDPGAVEATRRFFRAITPQLAFATALVDPAAIVIAGALAPVVRDIVGEFRTALASRVQHLPRVEVSTLDEYAVASGAALLARAQLRELLVDAPDGVAPRVTSSVTAGLPEGLMRRRVPAPTR